MQNLLENFDDLADIKTENALVRLLERVIFVFMILMFVSAPHSIAATQISWLVGMFLWLIRMFLKPRRKLVKTPLDWALWTFLGWSVITSIFSYAPDISIDRLRGTLLFLIFYFVVNVVRTKRAAVFLAYAIVFSCMVNVVWTPIQRLIGRGVEIHGTAANSPLSKALLIDGDTLLEADGKKIKTPDDLVNQIAQNEVTKVKFYRPDFDFVVEVRRENLLGGANALERLGIESWKKSRNWRSSGFYGHYVTYAEVLQLLASLAFGLLIASFAKRKIESANETDENQKPKTKNNWLSTLPFSPFFLVCIAGMCFALLLTVTRAPQIGLLISAFSIVLLGASRKFLLILAIIVLPIAAAGIYVQQQSRQVGFFDAKDDSIRDRQTFYRKGFDLWTKNARNFTLGVGMDATQRFINEWDLFDNEGKPMGHFHSTPLQLLVERGLFGLILWLWILWAYGKTLVRYLRFRVSNSASDWRETGIILGSFGGAIGFFTSGIVHFNFGDAEVVMVFYMLMGLSICLWNSKFQIPNPKTCA